MAKLLVLILLAIVGWILFKGIVAKPAPPRRDRSADTRGTTPERMVKCALCGVFIPQSEALVRDGVETCRNPDSCTQRAA